MRGRFLGQLLIWIKGERAWHIVASRLRLRGLSGARDEFHLAAIVQNLKTLARRQANAP